jgi:hypothetical protein
MRQATPVNSVLRNMQAIRSNVARYAFITNKLRMNEFKRSDCLRLGKCLKQRSF